MDEVTHVIGPLSWDILQLRFWVDVDATGLVQQFEVARSSNVASLLQLGPREWWMISECPMSAQDVSAASDSRACVVDISAAYLALIIKGGDVYRTTARLGNAHNQHWLALTGARRLRMADCSVVVLRPKQDELTIFVARSEVEHLLLSVQMTLNFNAPQ